MGKEKATTYLKGLGYNVIRHPREGLGPLTLIGHQNGAWTELGPLELLITNPPGPLPTLERDLAAPDINGKSSSKLKLGIGVNILGNIIGALGGNLGINVNYTNAKTIQFSFTDVLLDRTIPLEVGNYLKNADVDAANLILQQYILGNGKLFLITRTAKTNKLTVSYERESGVGATVDVPVVQQMVGGKVSVETQSGASSVITFSGQKQITFAFRCFEVGILHGELTLTAVKEGDAFLGFGEEEDDDNPSVFEPCMIDVGARPASAGSSG